MSLCIGRRRKHPSQKGQALRLTGAQVCVDEREGVHMPSKINSKASDNQLYIHSIMILPQVHLRKPCYDFYFL